MKTFHIWLAIPALLISIACSAQIKNQKTDTVHIYGNCGMCKQKIEKAGNLKKTASVDWDKSTKMAVIKYNAKKTNRDEILKRIALSGYDSDEFLAPDEVYNKLPGCCKYDREAKASTKTNMKVEESEQIIESVAVDVEPVINEKTDQLQSVYEQYFSLKDALVKSDGTSAAAKAQELSKAIKVVDMGKLSHEEHMIWMKVLKEVNNDVKRISETKNIEQQREYFITLSQNMYTLAKVSKQENPVYYQHCPMANNGKGANWLSKEKTIKNPYFGSKMLSCGKTVETIE